MYYAMYAVTVNLFQDFNTLAGIQSCNIQYEIYMKLIKQLNLHHLLIVYSQPPSLKCLLVLELNEGKS